MIDLKKLRENPDYFRKAAENKQRDPALVDEAIKLYDDWTNLLQIYEELRRQRNEIAHEGKPSEEGQKIKEKLKEAEINVTGAHKKYKEAVERLPNPALDNVPVGKNESENVELRKWGETPKFNFAPEDHLELGKNLGILDFETGAKVSGSQFYFLYQEGALLELALIQYALQLLSKEEFIPVITPDLAKSRYYFGTGYLPKGNEAQTYEIKDEDLGLIATAEVTLAGSHADEIIPEKDLPIKYIGYSHCFRKEAGAYGKYSKGIFRVHQFTKAEMFIYCLPEESNNWHEHILEMEEKIYQGLKLPYRVVEMCTGDLGAMAARKFDIEVWMPGRNEYGEVTSTSNCTDYQARNLNIRFKRKNGEIEYLHMLNGTAIATSRTILAILENYQKPDGSVEVPEILRQFVGKDTISPKS